MKTIFSPSSSSYSTLSAEETNDSSSSQSSSHGPIKVNIYGPDTLIATSDGDGKEIEYTVDVKKVTGGTFKWTKSGSAIEITSSDTNKSSVKIRAKQTQYSSASGDQVLTCTYHYLGSVNYCDFKITVQKPAALAGVVYRSGISPIWVDKIYRYQVLDQFNVSLSTEKTYLDAKGVTKKVIVIDLMTSELWAFAIPMSAPPGTVWNAAVNKDGHFYDLLHTHRADSADGVQTIRIHQNTWSPSHNTFGNLVRTNTVHFSGEHTFVTENGDDAEHDPQEDGEVRPPTE